MALANYVKFRRGTPEKFAAIVNKDADSLYFISEKDAAQGVLYLGDKLISGSLTATITLSDLEDVLLQNNITPNSILIYDGEQNKWVNKPFSEIFSEITGNLVMMQGATANANGVAGMVPRPMAGEQNLFLKGDATWGLPDGLMTPQQAREIVQLRTDVNGILGDDIGLSMRNVAAQEVAKVVAGAPGNLDTLKEIADWITDHPESFTEINTRIISLETGVGNLENEIAALHATDDDLQDQIDDLAYHLRWQRVNSWESE